MYRQPFLVKPHPPFEGGGELELESGFFDVVVDGAVGGGGVKKLTWGN